jgi:hypothetical protein
MHLRIINKAFIFVTSKGMSPATKKRKMKTQPRKNASLETILAGIRSGKYYVDALLRRKEGEFCRTPIHGLEEMKVDISTAGKIFDVDLRYVQQVVTIPSNQRGNLSKYAGRKVVVIPTTIAQSGARINFYIKSV